MAMVAFEAHFEDGDKLVTENRATMTVVPRIGQTIKLGGFPGKETARFVVIDVIAEPADRATVVMRELVISANPS